MDSDDDVRVGGSAETDDVNLPKATVAKIVSGEPCSLFALLQVSVAHQTRLSSLPQTTELLPPEFTCAKEAKDLMTECCKGGSSLLVLCCYSSLYRTEAQADCSLAPRRVSLLAAPAFSSPPSEFVLTIASEANEICDKDSKKTMVPEHILAALKVSFKSLGLG